MEKLVICWISASAVAKRKEIFVTSFKKKGQKASFMPCFATVSKRGLGRPLLASLSAAKAFIVATVIAVWLSSGANPVPAGTIFNFSDNALGGGSRWDAAPRMANLGGTNFERSLNGGLRYSLQGGSFQAFRDRFTWQAGQPTVAAFQMAVQQAFDAWTVPDPATGLTSQLAFVADVGTPVVGFNNGQGGLDSRALKSTSLAQTMRSFGTPESVGRKQKRVLAALLAR